MRSNGRATPEDLPMNHERSGSKVGPFLLGAAVGAVAGAVIALMYAPAAGEDLRRQVSDKLDDLTEGAKDIVAGIQSTAEKMFSEGRGQADEIIDRTRERADDMLEEADRAIAEARRRSRRNEDFDDNEE